MPSTPGWVNVLAGGVPGVIAAYNFQTGQYWAQGNPSGRISVNSTTGQYVVWSDGHVSNAPAGNLPVSDLGLSNWEGSNNLVASPNDLTNAAWTKTNMTAALNATGPDLVLNSASTITATAGNATVTQAITQASTNEQASIFIRRVTGSGAVNMTIDNGATWTAVTVTSGWTQVSIPQQTLANPTFGLQIVTNGDAVAVWCAQVEPALSGTGPTGPMPSGNRTVCAVSMGALQFLPGTSGTILVKKGPFSRIGGILLNIGFSAFTIQGVTASTVKNTAVGGTILTATSGSGTFSSGDSKVCLAFDANGRSLVMSGGAVVSDAHLVQGGVYPTIGTGIDTDGYVRNAVFWQSRLPNATLQTLSTLP